jgi:hypothetical protein
MTGTSGTRLVAMARAEERLRRWRESRPTRAIPEPLWSMAVGLAAEYGIGRVSRALRLDYYSLKRRVESREGAGEAAKPRFVDVIAGSVSVGEGTAEFEDASGARIRVEWKGGVAPDLAALTRTFFGGAP